MSYQDLQPQQAHEAMQDDPELRILDVRTTAEHHHHRISGAILMPVQEIRARWSELDPAGRYLVYCEHGVRSVVACEFLSSQGFDELRNLRGGMVHWAGAGLPVER